MSARPGGQDALAAGQRGDLAELPASRVEQLAELVAAALPPPPITSTCRLSTSGVSGPGSSARTASTISSRASAGAARRQVARMRCAASSSQSCRTWDRM